MHQRWSVGLTGGIGSGKTTIANMFAELGANLIDTDLIAHQLCQTGGAAIEPIIQAFGSDFIDQHGLRRDKMRELVFSQAQAKQKLEHILHPLIRQACELQAQTATGNYPLFVVPLLVESGTWVDRVNRILVCDCTTETQIQRVMQRNGFSREQVEKILRAQASREQRQQVAHDILDTEQDLSRLRIEVERLDAIYRKFAISG